MDELIRTQLNDIRAGAESGFRHFLDTQWKTAPFHMHPHYEFYLFIHGKVQIRIEDESFDAHPMDLFIFPPDVLHRALILDSSCPYERAFFYATRKILADLSDESFPLLDILEEAARRGDYSYHADEGSATRFIRLVDECISDAEEQDPSTRLMNRCRVNLLSLIACKTVRQKNVLSPRPPDRINEVIRYINDHILEPVSLDSLSDRFFVSKYTLLHEFKSYANISIHQYILYKRILYAQRLMQRGVAPGNAARQSGFNDYAGFYRAFVRQNSITPQEYYVWSRGGGGPA